MVVVQPTAFCNINCTYCYLPDRSNKHVMAQSTVTRLFSEVFASGWAGPEIIVLWHAGEPMAAPISFYREAFATIERLRPPSVNVKHSFQTNGTLIERRLVPPVPRMRTSASASASTGRARYTTATARRAAARARSTRRWPASAACRGNGVPFHVLSVLSNDSLADARRDAGLLRERGHRQGLLQRRGIGRHLRLRAVRHGRAELRTRFAAFLRRFWHQARAERPGEVRARDRPGRAAPVPPRGRADAQHPDASRWPC